MKTIFASVSESSSLDLQTGRLSIFHILEDLHISSFPAFVPSICLSAVCEREQDEPSTVTVDIVVLLGGLQIAHIPSRIDFHNQRKARAISYIQGLAINRPADLEISVNFGQQTLFTWKVGVHHIGQPQATTTTAPPSQQNAQSRSSSAGSRRSRRTGS